MNWTGGHLQQSRRTAGGISAQQRAYFAKARTKVLNGDGPKPALDFAAFKDIEVEPKYAGTAHLTFPEGVFDSSPFAAQNLDKNSLWGDLDPKPFQELGRTSQQSIRRSYGKQRTKSGETYSRRKDQSGLQQQYLHLTSQKVFGLGKRKNSGEENRHKKVSDRHRILEDKDLEYKRQELLQRQDWLGMPTAKPLHFEPLREQDQNRVARRRKLNEDDFARRGSKRVRPTEGRNNLRESRSPYHIRSQEEKISIRHGTQIHRTQQTPVSRHSSGLRAKEHIARYEGMLICSSQDAKPCSKLEQYGQGQEVLGSPPALQHFNSQHVQQWLAEDSTDIYSESSGPTESAMDCLNQELKETPFEALAEASDERLSMEPIGSTACFDQNTNEVDQDHNEPVANALRSLEQARHQSTETLRSARATNHDRIEALPLIKPTDLIFLPGKRSGDNPANIPHAETMSIKYHNLSSSHDNNNDEKYPWLAHSKSEKFPTIDVENQSEDFIEKRVTSHPSIERKEHIEDAIESRWPIENITKDDSPLYIHAPSNSRQETQAPREPLKDTTKEVSQAKHNELIKASSGSETQRPVFAPQVSFLSRPAPRVQTLEEQNEIWYKFIFGDNHPSSRVFDPKAFNEPTSNPPVPASSSSPLPPRFPSSPIPSSLKSTAVQASSGQQQSPPNQPAQVAAPKARETQRQSAEQENGQEALRSSSTDPLARYPDPSPEEQHKSIPRSNQLAIASTAATKAPSSPAILTPLPTTPAASSPFAKGQSKLEPLRIPHLPTENHHYSTSVAAHASSSPNAPMEPQHASPGNSSSPPKISPVRAVFIKPARFEGANPPSRRPGKKGAEIRLGASAVGSKARQLRAALKGRQLVEGQRGMAAESGAGGGAQAGIGDVRGGCARGEEGQGVGEEEEGLCLEEDAKVEEIDDSYEDWIEDE